MKAWLLKERKGLDAMSLGELPDPTPGAGQVCVNVLYAALNPADRYLAEDQYPAKPTFPHVLGRDGVGIVSAVGEGVAGDLLGRKVVLLRSDVGVNLRGTLAEKVIVPASSIADAPKQWSDPSAAGACLVYVTAWQALTQWGELRPGVVLITGASGGVGVASVQLARVLGHRVVALSRGTSKRDALLKMGAEVVLDPSEKGWPLAVKKALGTAKVDLVVDSVGGTILPQAIETLGMWGKVSLVGRLAGPVPDFNTATLFFRRLRLGGIAINTYSDQEIRSLWEKTVEVLTARGVEPVVDSVFPFAEARAAFDKLATGPLGKVVVKVGA